MNRFCVICMMGSNVASFAKSWLSCLPTPSFRRLRDDIRSTRQSLPNLETTPSADLSSRRLHSLCTSRSCAFPKHRSPYHTSCSAKAWIPRQAMPALNFDRPYPCSPWLCSRRTWRFFAEHCQWFGEQLYLLCGSQSGNRPAPICKGACRSSIIFTSIRGFASKTHFFPGRYMFSLWRLFSFCSSNNSLASDILSNQGLLLFWK